MLGGVNQFAIVIIFVSIISYSTAIIAQYFGAGRFPKCSLVLTQAILVGLISYPIIVALGHMQTKFLFENSNIHPIQMRAQIEYFDILIRFSILTLLRVSLVSFFSGIGRTKVIMISSITSMLVNVFANWALIFGHLGFPPMGAKGAAYGTILGMATAVVILLITYLSPQNIKRYKINKSLAIDLKGIKRLLYYGYPLGLGTFLNFLAFNVIINIYHQHGPVAASAITITYSWDMIFFVPLLGMEVAIISLVGRYIGAEDEVSLNKTLKSVMKLSFAYGLIMIVVILATPNFLVDLFRPKDNLEIFLTARPLILTMVKLISIYVISEVIRVVFTGVLKGAGDTTAPMLITMVVHWISVLITWLCFTKTNLNNTTIWFLDVVVTIFSGALVYLRYRTGNWRTLRILKN
jgi:MATE family multidrug resistance protein